MYTTAHQAWYRFTVPPLIGPVREVVFAGQNGWTEQTARWVNCAVSLLLSATGNTDPKVLMLAERLPIVEERLSPTSQPGQPQFCFENGKVFAPQTLVGYLLTAANALGHEAQHAALGHSAVPETHSLERIEIRADWEAAAFDGEQQLQHSLLHYIAEVQRATGTDSSPWRAEIEHYNRNARRHAAHFAGRSTIVKLVRTLIEVAHHDSSVKSPPDSAVYKYAGSLIRRLLEVHAVAIDSLKAQAEAALVISRFGIPESLPQAERLREMLALWQMHATIEKSVPIDGDRSKTIFLH